MYILLPSSIRSASSIVLPSTPLLSNCDGLAQLRQLPTNTTHLPDTPCACTYITNSTRPSSEPHANRQVTTLLRHRRHVSTAVRFRLLRRPHGRRGESLSPHAPTQEVEDRMQELQGTQGQVQRVSSNMSLVQAAQDAMRLPICARPGLRASISSSTFSVILDQEDRQREQFNPRKTENAVVHILYTDLNPVDRLVPDTQLPRRASATSGRHPNHRRAPVPPTTGQR